MWSGNQQGFGRGRSIDQKHRFREELAEVELERADEEDVISRGLQGFDSAFQSLNLVNGGESDYDSVYDHLDRDAIESPQFWKRVFNKYKDNIYVSGLFASLPPELQRDSEIQDVFLGQASFTLGGLPRTTLDNLGREYVVDELLSGESGILMERVPWDILSPEEKRKYVLSGVREVPQYSGAVRSLMKSRSEFKDVISDDEWGKILEKRFTENGGDLILAIRINLEDLQEQISSDKLRVLLKRVNSSGIYEGKLIYFELNLLMIRKLGFSEGEIEAWKEHNVEELDFQGAFYGYGEMSLEDRNWALQTLSGSAALFNEGYEDYVSNKLPKQLQRLAAGSVDGTVRSVFSLLGRQSKNGKVEPKDISEIIRSTIDAQGPAGFRVLNFLDQDVVWSSGGYTESVSMIDHLLLDKESIKVYKQIMSKTGARFQDFLSFYSNLRFLDNGHGSDLHILSGNSFKDEELLIPFVESGLPWATYIYEEFEDRVGAGEDNETVVRELFKEVQEGIDSIQLGEMPETGMDNRMKALLTYVFPPALGVSREEYSALVERRKDRQNDVPHELDALQGREVSFSLGNWELQEGQEFDIAAWDYMREVTSDINGKRIIKEGHKDIAEDEFLLDREGIVNIGREMVEILGQSSSVKTKKSLRDLYALYLLQGGAKLPDFVLGREDAIRMTEWAKDSLRDTIDVALSAYRETNPEKFDDEVTLSTKREVKPKARKKISGAIAGMLKSTRMADQKKSERIGTMLGRIGIDVEGDVLGTFRDLFKASDSGSELLDIDNYIKELLKGSVGVGNQAGKLSPMLVSKILGGHVDKMKHEIKKWKFVEGAEGGEERTFRFEITKKQLHAVAGMNMGVCVAVDDKLWNKPEFMNVVLFADDGIARGGMHFEVIHDGDKTYLSLPGINPNIRALREVDAEKLTDAMLQFAKDSARAIGAESVLIPTQPVIFSNREELHESIKKKRFPIHSLSKSHRFSYAPFAYEWQDAFEIKLNEE